MKVKVVEDEKEKLKIEVADLTFVNVLNEAIWEQKPDVSGYAKEHPYLSEPVLLVRAKNPKKVVADATQQLIDDIEALKKQLTKK